MPLKRLTKIFTMGICHEVSFCKLIFIFINMLCHWSKFLIYQVYNATYVTWWVMLYPVFQGLASCHMYYLVQENGACTSVLLQLLHVNDVDCSILANVHKTTDLYVEYLDKPLAHTRRTNIWSRRTATPTLCGRVGEQHTTCCDWLILKPTNTWVCT